MIGDIVQLVTSVVDLIDHQTPGWRARAQRRLARIEAKLPHVKSPKRCQQMRIRAITLRGMLRETDEL